MPLYTYRCSNCGVQFDQQQKFTDEPWIRCPECGKKSLHKVYSPVGVVFKGSGFYATDHRSPSGMTNSEEKTKPEADATKKTEEKKTIKEKTKPVQATPKEKE